MKKTIELKIEDRTVTVKRLQLLDTAIVLKKLNQLPKGLMSMSKVSTDEIISTLPVLIADSLPELADIVSTATDLSKEEIMELGLADFTKIIDAILQVNAFEEIMGFLRIIQGRYRDQSTKKTRAVSKA